MPKISLEVVTAERLVFSGDVDSVTAPGSDGELTILPRHAPLLTTLRPGVLRLKSDDVESELAISGGFLEVEPNRVRVLADAAERPEEIDVDGAQAALDRAKAAIDQAQRGGQTDMRAAIAELRRSQVRLKVARRRRPNTTQHD